MENIKTLTKLPTLWCIKDCQEVATWAAKTFKCFNIVSDNYLHIDMDQFPYRDCYSFKSQIDSGYTKISLDDFRRLVPSLVLSSFKLPENWTIKITEENQSILKEWVESQPEFRKGYLDMKGHMKVGYHVISQPYDESYQLWVETLNEYQNKYKKITFEQFKKYVLKQEDQPVMEKKIKGYELVKSEYLAPARRILGCMSDNDHHPLDIINNEDDIDELKKAGVLDIWFKPVYTPIYKVGDWVYFDGNAHQSGPHKLKSVFEDGKGGYDQEGSFRDLTSPKYRLATDKEIEDHLIEEAKKRGIVPGVTLAKTGINAEFSFKFKPIAGYRYYRLGDILDSININGSGEGYIYENGQWAEIVKTPKIEIKGYEAKIESGQVKFGCQTYSNEFIRTLATCLDVNNLNMAFRDEIIELSNHLKD